jgi:hypothetical protein
MLVSAMTLEANFGFRGLESCIKVAQLVAEMICMEYSRSLSLLTRADYDC